MKYRQITSGERYAIAALRTRGLSPRETAAQLGRDILAAVVCQVYKSHALT